MNNMDKRKSFFVVKGFFALMAACAVLTGCAGAGTGTGSGGDLPVAHSIANSYEVKIVESPFGNSAFFEFLMISNSGVIVGKADGKLFTYKDGKVLGAAPDGAACIPISVTDDGTVRGYFKSGDEVRPFTMNGSDFVEDTIPNGFSQGKTIGIDADGYVYSTFRSGINWRSFRKKNGAEEEITVANAKSVMAEAVSRDGRVSGRCIVDSKSASFVTAPHSLSLDLFITDKSATTCSINDSGDIVGTSISNDKAFVYYDGHYGEYSTGGADPIRILKSISNGSIAVGSENNFIPVGWSSFSGYVNMRTRIDPIADFLLGATNSVNDYGVIVGNANLQNRPVGVILTPKTQ